MVRPRRAHDPQHARRMAHPRLETQPARAGGFLSRSAAITDRLSSASVTRKRMRPAVLPHQAGMADDSSVTTTAAAVVRPARGRGGGARDEASVAASSPGGSPRRPPTGAVAAAVPLLVLVGGPGSAPALGAGPKMKWSCAASARLAIVGGRARPAAFCCGRWRPGAPGARFLLRSARGRRARPRRAAAGSLCHTISCRRPGCALRGAQSAQQRRRRMLEPVLTGSTPRPRGRIGREKKIN